MDELILRFAAIQAKLNALKSALDSEQLIIYNQSISKSK